MKFLFVLLFISLLNISRATYLDYVHPGQNKTHHYKLGKSFSDEWLGMCIYALKPQLTDSTITDPDPRQIASKSGLRSTTVNHNAQFENASQKTMSASKNGKPLPFSPNSGDEKGLKVLFVSIDNRELTTARHPKGELKHGAYASFSAAINYDYATHHGYDFLFITLNSTSLEAKLQPKYNCTSDLIEVPSFENRKYGPSSYHINMQYMRASSWNKIPPLYHLSYEYGHLYDWILYIDSDVTLNPVYLNRSLSQVLHEWQTQPSRQFGQSLPNNNQYVQWGQTNLNETNMIFLTNFPWRDDMPCAGIFMFRPNKRGLVQLQDWWNFNLPSKNLYDFMEQDALWYMKEADSDDLLHKDEAVGDSEGDKHRTVNARGIINNKHLRGRMSRYQSNLQRQAATRVIYDFAINSSTMSLVYEPQFASSAHGVNDLHFLHMASYVPQKMAYMIGGLRRTHKKLHGEKLFVAHMTELREQHSLHLDVLGLVEKLELHRSIGYYEAESGSGEGRTEIKYRPYQSFPLTYDGKSDSTWHAAESSAILTPERRKPLWKALGDTYNGFVIKYNNDADLFLVINGTRHQFPDFETFVNMKYDIEEVLVFKDRSKRARVPEHKIPLGTPLLPFKEQHASRIFASEPTSEPTSAPTMSPTTHEQLVAAMERVKIENERLRKRWEIKKLKEENEKLRASLGEHS